MCKNNECSSAVLMYKKVPMSLKFKKLNGAEMHTFLQTRLGVSHDFT
jgi:hypothetical protein